MEIGSFIELDLRKNLDLFNKICDFNSIGRFNSARTAIKMALKKNGFKKVCLPHYICPSVPKFLNLNGVKCSFYYLNNDLLPDESSISEDIPILIVNFFGVFNNNFIEPLKDKFATIIVDNSQAFFSKPLTGCYNVYSPRKFFGVPDGAYLIGENAHEFEIELEKDFSSETSSFLFERHEKGCNAIYEKRMLNEKRIEMSGCKSMSQLTRLLLDSIDYKAVSLRRRSNFLLLHEKIGDYNEFDVMNDYSNSTPMVYPFLCNRLELEEELKKNYIYTGRWWSKVMNEVNQYAIEYKFSKYMLPLPIDQRYGKSEMEKIANIILSSLK